MQVSEQKVLRPLGTSDLHHRQSGRPDGPRSSVEGTAHPPAFVRVGCAVNPLSFHSPARHPTIGKMTIRKPFREVNPAARDLAAAYRGPSLPKRRQAPVSRPKRGISDRAELMKEDDGGGRNHGSLGGAAVACALIVLSLIAINVVRHRLSMAGSGGTTLLMDVCLLLACAAIAIWVLRQRHGNSTVALSAGARVGLMSGSVAVTNHAIELFSPRQGAIAQFVFGAGPLLLIMAFFAAAGSAGRERTRSVILGAVAGIWCSIVALLLLLSFAFACNLAFGALAELRLQQPFVASGMTDPGAFLVRNSLDAASEFLVRMPVLALSLSFMGGIANAWLRCRSRSLAFLFACLMPMMFAAGVVALWYTSTLERPARPPFVTVGVLLAATALIGIHPVWSAVRRTSPG